MNKSKASTLAAAWSRPDHSVLMPKQVSIRLPALVAAKIAAICEMYPARSRSELLIDLIATALEDFPHGLEYIGVGKIGELEDGEVIYDHYEGSGGRYDALVAKHVKLIEKELGVTLTTSGAKNDPD